MFASPVMMCGLAAAVHVSVLMLPLACVVGPVLGASHSLIAPVSSLASSEPPASGDPPPSVVSSPCAASGATASTPASFGPPFELLEDERQPDAARPNAMSSSRFMQFPLSRETHDDSKNSRQAV